MPARIWPPPDDERPQDLVISDDVDALSEWLVQFEINLSDAEAASRFTRAYGMRFQSAGVTARREKSYIALRVGAGSAHEAGVLAAMTVKVAAALRLAEVEPLAAHLHHVEEVGRLSGIGEQRRRAERAELLRLAASLPMPGSQEPSASGQAAPPKRVRRPRWLANRRRPDPSAGTD